MCDVFQQSYFQHKNLPGKIIHKNHRSSTITMYRCFYCITESKVYTVSNNEIFNLFAYYQRNVKNVVVKTKIFHSLVVKPYLLTTCDYVPNVLCLGRPTNDVKTQLLRRKIRLVSVLFSSSFPP